MVSISHIIIKAMKGNFPLHTMKSPNIVTNDTLEATIITTYSFQSNSSQKFFFNDSSPFQKANANIHI